MNWEGLNVAAFPFAIRHSELGFPVVPEEICELLKAEFGEAVEEIVVAGVHPYARIRPDRWLGAAGIGEGPLFQALHLGRPSGRSLRTCSIRRLVKRVARSAGLPKPVADQLSGHSMRVGAAQDMMVTGFDMLAIMQAGGWKTPTVVARYVENASTRSLHERRWAALGVAAG